MVECKLIPLSELQVGRWYVGRGRNANVGLWNGDCFLVIGLCGTPISWEPRKWVNEPCLKQEPYFTAVDGCFQPFLLVDEGVASGTIEGRYAMTLTFSTDTAI
jgi:hypothetical protein